MKQELVCGKQMKDKTVRKTNTRTCLACSALLFAYLKKWLDHGLTQRILSFFPRTPPDGLFQLTQKKFFTGVSKNTSLEKYLKISQENFSNFIINLQVQGNAQFVQKVTFEPLIDFKQNNYGT